jgi:hemolysin activation/secretion protein
VVENYKTLIGSNHFKVSILFLVGIFSCPLQGGVVEAQISPEGRDRTYKQAAPHRFKRRFDKPVSPKSSVVPIKPKSMAPIFPEDLKEVKFVLKQLFIQGKSIYDKRALKPLYTSYLKKELTLKNIYEIAQKNNQ